MFDLRMYFVAIVATEDGEAVVLVVHAGSLKPYERDLGGKSITHK